MNLLDIFYQLLHTTSVGDKQGQQMIIQILILRFKGLNLVQLNLSTTAAFGTEESCRCRGVAVSGGLTEVIFY